jgi:hypothetical protein
VSVSVRRTLVPLLAVLAGTGACGAAAAPTPPANYRVSANPYAAVDWAAGPRLKVQLHDHVGVDTSGLRAYDRAGYDAMSLMTYSGAPVLPYAWTARRWPPDQWLPATFLVGLGRIRWFIPNGEEVGEAHVISPYLTQFITRDGGMVGTIPPDAIYTSTQGCIDAILRYGGLAFVAHPWVPAADLLPLRDYTGIEIYSAFAKYKDEVVRDSIGLLGEREKLLLAAWDSLLIRNPAVFGIAVNDHYGPAAKVADLPATIRDSGKIIAFASDWTELALREALRTGRFIAVADLGAVKDRYPALAGITITDSTLTLATGDAVRWIGGGRPLAEGASLRLAGLPAGLTYARAEIRNAEGSVVFTQAFRLTER